MRTYKIIEKKNLWITLSLLVILAGSFVGFKNAMAQRPILNFGIDFTGGTSLILKFDDLSKQYANRSETVSVSDVNIAFIQNVRRTLALLGLEKSTIQITNDQEVIIRTIFLNNQKRLELQSILSDKIGTLEVLEIDIIGPTIGQELRETSIWIILIVSIALLVYITWRFELAFGLSALVATLHDGLITLSLASILNIEINTAFVAALLTILGYSINDTIVVFDRIRENLGKSTVNDALIPMVNASIAQTFYRTINTSFTTLFVIVCLLLFGGTTIKGFALVLLIGIIAGTYSSIFIASPVFVIFYKKLKKIE